MIKNKKRRNIFVCCTRASVASMDVNNDHPLVSKDMNVDSNSRLDYLAWLSGQGTGKNARGRGGEDNTESDQGVYSGKRKQRKKKVSRIIKAVLMFEFSLARKTWRRKYRKPNKDDEKTIIQATEISNSLGTACDESSPRANPHISSSLFGNSSTTTSTISLSSRSLDASSVMSKRSSSRICLENNTFVVQKEAPDPKNHYYELEETNFRMSAHIVLRLLLLSLVFLVLWGKACAILCTLTWLLFGPGRFSKIRGKKTMYI
ncbi:hypothetical protein Droror1_Dr00014961 [Drosera rotundifolia]